MRLDQIPNPTVFGGLVTFYAPRVRVDDRILVQFATEAEAGRAVEEGGEALALRNMLMGGISFLAGIAINWIAAAVGLVITLVCGFFFVRTLTRAHHLAEVEEEEMAAEPWFYVGPHDMFPEEFLPFIGLHGELRELFLQAHGDLFDAEFWKRMQALHRAGEIVDIFPYQEAHRIRSP